jgi:hypothetical protein
MIYIYQFGVFEYSSQTIRLRPAGAWSTRVVGLAADRDRDRDDATDPDADATWGSTAQTRRGPR